MRVIFLLPHLGLGDAIIINGLVRELVLKHERVVLPVKWHNRTSVKWMLEDVKNILLLGVNDDSDMLCWAERFHGGKTNVLKLGLFEKGQIDLPKWDEQFYRQAGVDFEKRWTGFRLPEKARVEECDKEWPPFIHEDASRGFLIDRRRVPSDAVPVARTRTIFDALSWLRNAPEIHCIDSSFISLVESVETKAAKLCFHKYARQGGRPPTLRKKWEILV